MPPSVYQGQRPERQPGNPTLGRHLESLPNLCCDPGYRTSHPCSSLPPRMRRGSRRGHRRTTMTKQLARCGLSPISSPKSSLPRSFACWILRHAKISKKLYYFQVRLCSKIKNTELLKIKKLLAYWLAVAQAGQSLLHQCFLLKS